MRAATQIIKKLNWFRGAADSARETKKKERKMKDSVGDPAGRESSRRESERVLGALNNATASELSRDGRMRETDHEGRWDTPSYYIGYEPSQRMTNSIENVPASDLES